MPGGTGSVNETACHAARYTTSGAAAAAGYRLSRTTSVFGVSQPAVTTTPPTAHATQATDADRVRTNERRGGHASARTPVSPIVATLDVYQQAARASSPIPRSAGDLTAHDALPGCPLRGKSPRSARCSARGRIPTAD